MLDLSKFITKAQFEEKQVEFCKVIHEMLHTDLVHPDIRNQITAKLLGYDSFDQVNALFIREDAIKDDIWAEQNYFNADIIDIKAGNIQFSLNTSTGVLLGHAFANDTEFVPLRTDMASVLVEISKFGVRFEDVEWKKILFKGGKAQPQKLSINLSSNGENFLNLLFVRTKAKLTVTVSEIEDKKMLHELGQFKVNFSEANGDFDKVDLVTPTPLMPAKEWYEWTNIRNDSIEDGGQVTVMGMVGQNNDVPLSNIRFTSQEQAIEAVEQEHIGYDSASVQGCSVIKVTKTVVTQAI